MAGYKETPRQKMMSMMYLVLTAMLALNVSKDIIQAFVTVNESMEQTNESLHKKLSDTYSKFESQATIGGQGAKDWYKKALIAKNLSDSLVSYLEHMKNELIVFSDRSIKTLEQADTTPLVRIKAKDNFDDPTRFFLGTDVSKGKAEEMKRVFKDYKEKISQLVKEEDRPKLQLGLITEGEFVDEYGAVQTWEQHYFYHTILAADLVILNKYIADVRNAEFDIITFLSSYIGATDFKFNKIAAKVIPTRKYLFKGEEYQAEILVAAYDTTSSPNVVYRLGIDKWLPSYAAGASSITKGELGTAQLKISTAGMDYGPKKFAGAITILNPLGVEEQYEFSDEFVVQEPIAVISLDKMSVLYIGLSNPVTVSVPGIPPDNLDIRILGPAESKRLSAGRFEIKPTAPGTLTMQVYAQIDNTSRLMGERSLRLLPVPDPTIVVGGKTAGQSIALADLQNAKVDAVLKGFLFDDVRFIVTRFEVLASISGLTQSVTVRGNTMSDEAKNMLRRLGSNQQVIISNISVRGPDGKDRPLSTAVNLKTL